MEMKYFPSIDPQATGKRIMQLRKEHGLSVKDLQEYLGFEAPQAIYKWQNGANLPQVDHLLALSVLLDVPMEDILVTAFPIEKSMKTSEPAGSVFLRNFRNCA